MGVCTELAQSDRAVAVALDYLRHVGIDWSPHPTKDEVRQEYERIWRQVGNRSIDELVDLPLMSDAKWRATLGVLTEVVTPALFTDQNLLSLVICRMVNLSLEHGNSDGSCFAYVWLGMILGPHFGAYHDGVYLVYAQALCGLRPALVENFSHCLRNKIFQFRNRDLLF